LLHKKFTRQRTVLGYNFETVGHFFHEFYHKKLPFELTAAQKRVIREIRADLGMGRQMNRLLQGDVGSGKTVVALMSLLIALDNGYQGTIMAPTEILAQQHYKSLTELLEGMDIGVELLTGSIKGKPRREILQALKEGEIHILIGTHALLEEPVIFKSLGLAIIDEQHRFGVAQRARLWRKSKPYPPHVLVMTATPIPRTLAMSYYGDLDVSTIDELPPGRKPVQTVHFYESQRPKLFEFMKREIAKGRQIYVVYPLIEESEKLDLANLVSGYENLLTHFKPPDFQISVVHGRMTPADKEFEMNRFLSGKTHIMVATTVIEVGVNIPNASVMIIENTERFGLSQLHQLRGRVGRGSDQSYCILMTSYKLTSDARTRIQTMVRTNNGFEIAEVDLRLRGPGEIEGTRQSGALDFKLANLATDGHILRAARQIARGIIEHDPELSSPENRLLAQHLSTYYKLKGAWSLIS
jgi:ATP-dependent DNA helicase RecG